MLEFSRSAFEKKNEPVPEPQEGTREYVLESGVHVHLQFKELRPGKREGAEGEEDVSESTVIFLPGWEVDAADPSTQTLAGEFAESSGKEALAISVSSDGRGASRENGREPDCLYDEAVAVSRFITERGLTNVTIAGYSSGGDRAINVVHILQNDPSLKVNGLVLLAPTGLYEQGPGELARNLVKDSFVRTPANLLRQDPTSFKHWLRVAADVGLHLADGISRSVSSIGRLKQDAKELAVQNPRIGEITCPVVLMTGGDDTVIEAEKVIPEGEMRNTIASREAFLQAELFKSSPFVKMLIPKKLSNHGMPYFRARSVADASLYMLERFHRSSRSEAA